MAQNLKSRFEYASFQKRLLAFGVDAALLIIINILINFAFGRNLFALPSSSNLLSIVTQVFRPMIVTAIATVTVWVLWNGQTPGMRWMHIRIVKTDGSRLDIGTAIIRYIGFVISGLVANLGHIWMLFDDHKQTWQDKMAKTYVIETDTHRISSRSLMLVVLFYILISGGVYAGVFISSGVINSPGDIRSLYDTLRTITAIQFFKPEVKKHWELARIPTNEIWDLDWTDPEQQKIIRPKARAAIEELKIARDLDPNNAIIYMRLGDLYGKLDGDPAAEKSHESYKTAVALDPKNGEYHTFLGNALNRLGRYEEAIASFNKTLELYNDDRHAYKGLGEAYQNLQQFDKALEYYLKAIDEYTKFNTKGSYYKQIREIEQALADIPK